MPAPDAARNDSCLPVLTGVQSKIPAIWPHVAPMIANQARWSIDLGHHATYRGRSASVACHAITRHRGF
jgi:hypothetical protein